VLLVGAVVGLGSFTFGYGEGFSYLSTDPDSCLNCHVMQEYHDSWQGGSHRHVATCIDCHLPHETIPKYIAKADNGFFHSLAFTLENYHEPIQIKDRNARILQESCEHCHEATVHAMSTTFLAAASESAAAGEVACIHCHHRVGHGPS